MTKLLGNRPYLDQVKYNVQREKEMRGRGSEKQLVESFEENSQRRNEEDTFPYIRPSTTHWCVL